MMPFRQTLRCAGVVALALAACGSSEEKQAPTAESVCAETCKRLAACGGDGDECAAICPRCAREHCSAVQLESWQRCNDEHAGTCPTLESWMQCLVAVNGDEEGCTIWMGTNCM